MRRAGKKIRAYIDTNIFIYAIIHHPQWGEICIRILKDAQKGLYEASGSLMVAIELLGALSKIDPAIARRATIDYLSLPITIFPLDEKTLKVASIINLAANIGYDALHLASMIINNINVVISRDIDDWNKAVSKIDDIVSLLKEEGFELDEYNLKLVTPEEYDSWIKSLR